MIHELNPVKFETVRPLFRPLAHQPFCTAVLAGLHPGRVFVDDPEQPQAAFVTREDPWCFLAGNPDNKAFNEALNLAIFRREIIGEDLAALLFTCHPEGWHTELATVLHPRQPIPMQRRHYVGRELTYDWRADLPAGFSIHPMDEALLERPGLAIPREVEETIDKWRSWAGAQLTDLGFVAIHADDAAQEAEVASWATVDAIVEGVGDAGLFTVAKHRRRGLATITAAAALEHSLSHGVSAVHWTCAESNIASIRTAEKLGFRRQPDYIMHYLVFEEAQHLGNLGYMLLQEQRYQESADLFVKVLALPGDPPAWAYHDVARAWAALGDRDKAFEYLGCAIDRGWSNVEETKECREFRELQDLPDWAAMIEKMQAGKQA
jgi:RimJ/RimL family protein N-acetyltransferase